MLKQNPLGIFCFLIAVIALGLAVIPGIALDKPLQVWPAWESPPPPPPRVMETTGGTTLRYKSFAVTVGGKTAPVAQPAQAAALPLTPRDHWLKCFALVAASCSLLAIVLGPFAWAMEKQPGISGPALLIATVALTWQYIAVGIAVGVALAIVLMLVAAFSWQRHAADAATKIGVDCN